MDRTVASHVGNGDHLPPVQLPVLSEPGRQHHVPRPYISQDQLPLHLHQLRSPYLRGITWRAELHPLLLKPVNQPHDHKLPTENPQLGQLLN